jgi:hypothetical protein
VLTGLFTGKASVTLDTSKLNLPNGSNYAFKIIYPGDKFAFNDFEQIVLEPRSSQFPPEDENNNTPNSQIKADMIPMQDTGLPLGLAILSIFTIISGTVYNRKK